MGLLFEELDHCETSLGTLALRRRRDLSLGVDVYEVKLDDEFLMSSLFTTGEIALATLGLADVEHAPADVLVGGLGLGFTASAALNRPNVRSVTVVEKLPAVISWHQRRLLPLGVKLTSNRRCRMVEGDFFNLLLEPPLPGAAPGVSGSQFHAVLVDIDHSPRHLLHQSHGRLYEVHGLKRLLTHLHPGGAFALWSNDPLDADFLSVLEECFVGVRAEVVMFRHPSLNVEATNTIYIARASADRSGSSPP